MSYIYIYDISSLRVNACKFESVSRLVAMYIMG